MLHIVLVHPQIAPNTGNIGRTCACVGARLHLVHPLGFRITDAHLRRSGMDYWRELDVVHHESWTALQQHPARPARLWLLETGAGRSLWETAFADGDGLVFGSEGAGLPPAIRAELGARSWVTIPQARSELRSLNLATSAGVALFEAWRQVARRDGG